MNFLDEPTKSEVSKHKQVYAHYDIERGGVTIRLLLLDLRYDRQEGGNCASIMGQDQWDWLQRHLDDKDVDLHLIVSSTQVLRTEKGKDTWGEYPEQRDKLLKLIAKSPAQGVLLLSGDIHAAEISLLKDEEQKHYNIEFPLYEVTASGLNRLRCYFGICSYGWKNKSQIGFLKKMNFGEIDVSKSNDGTLNLLATLLSSETSEEEVLLRKNIRFAPRVRSNDNGEEPAAEPPAGVDCPK